MKFIWEKTVLVFRTLEATERVIVRCSSGG
jgi:hypothetical protein